MAYCNLDKAMYNGIGKYGIPEIEPYDGDTHADYWIGFNYAKSLKYCRSSVAVHFCLDDYQFETLWNHPTKYIENFRRCKFIMSPDFSIYYDIPIAIQLYNHYRKHWLSKYYQERGIDVLPIIEWGTKDSYEFCFDGEPKNSTVVISPSSCIQDQESYDIYNAGFKEMIKRLSPTKIICLTHSKKVNEYFDFTDKDVEFVDISTFRHKPQDEMKEE